MLDISADDIETWAQRHDAAAQLPKLVRRLVLASAPVTGIAMRGDAGIRLGEFDGLVESSAATAFVPQGLSVWELSTAKEVRRKLDEDFASRQSQSQRHADAAYVAVSARRFQGAQHWARSKRSLGIWRDVRLVDADDLATWIEQCPPVQVWFAELLNRPVAGLLSLEARMHRWTNRTAGRPLPREALLVGTRRRAAADQVRAWVHETSTPDRIVVRGVGHDEAAAFVAAALLADDDVVPAIVVDDKAAWRWLIRQPRAGVIIVDSPSIEVSEAPTGMRVVVASESSMATRADISLSRIPWRPLAELLATHGFAEPEAQKLAHDCGGELSTLQRLLGHDATPAWVDVSPTRELMAMLLIGAWKPDSERDRTLIEQLGIDPTMLEEQCASLANTTEAPIASRHDRFGQAYWTWTARTDSWQQLAPYLTASMVRGFVEVATRCLGENDRRYELPPEERWRAGLLTDSPTSSSEFRAGVAGGLLRLTLTEEISDRAARELGHDGATQVVRAILREPWRAWASVGNELPLLAEAAPEAFLHAAERSMRSDGGIAELLAQEEPVWGGSPHTNLLWALETLAWYPPALDRVVVLLAELDARDPGGKLANRPFASLSQALDGAIPQSASTVPKRVQLLRLLVDRFPAVAWKLLRDQLPSPFGIVFNSHRPTLASWAPGETRQAPPEDYIAHGRAVGDLVAEVAALEAAKWAEALPLLLRSEEETRSALLAALEQRIGDIEDSDHVLWTAIRQEIHLCHLRSANEDDEPLAILTRLYAATEPSSEEARIAWLFKPYPSLPEPHGGARDVEKRAAELRAESLDHILSLESGWQILARLVEVVEYPALVGDTLAKRDDAPQLLERLLDASAPRALWRAVPRFVAAHFHGCGGGGRDVIKRLAASDRVADACEVACALLPGDEVWDALDATGEPVTSAYWKRVTYLHDLSPGEWERGLQELIRHGRVAVSVELAGLWADSLDSRTALGVLNALRNLDDDEQIRSLVSGTMTSHYIEQLFRRVDADPTISDVEVVPLELTCLPWLDRSDRSVRRIHDALGSDPSLFVELLCGMYRDCREPDPTEPTEKQRQTAQVYARVIHGWRGVPGARGGSSDRDAELRRWVQAVVDGATESGRLTVAVHELARVLARGTAPDCIWPCIVARELLERGEHEELAEALFIARRNMRGAVTRDLGEGGKQERKLAETYSRDAEALESNWPRTAVLLRKLATSYSRNAEREDDAARTVRIDYGMDDSPP